MDYKILQNILQCVLHKYIFTIHIHNAITKICFRIRNSVFFFIPVCRWIFSLPPSADSNNKRQQCRQRSEPNVNVGAGAQNGATVMGATSGSARDEWQQLQTAKSILCRNNFNESVGSNRTLCATFPAPIFRPARKLVRENWRCN